MKLLALSLAVAALIVIAVLNYLLNDADLRQCEINHTRDVCISILR